MNPNAIAFSLLLQQRGRGIQSNQKYPPNNSSSQTHKNKPPPPPLPPPPPQQPQQSFSVQYVEPGSGIPQLHGYLTQPTYSSSFGQYHQYQYTHNHIPAIDYSATSNHAVSTSTKRSFSDFDGYSDNHHQDMQCWYCEPCDKEFTQQSAYETHIASHEQCKFPGCSFSGTKKVVIAHFHGSHGLYSGSGYKLVDVEGQKFRVLLGANPEEIEQWRAERRKKFPTSANIERKLQSQEQLEKAGGIGPTDGRKKRKLARTTDSLQQQNESNTDAPPVEGEGIEGIRQFSKSSDGLKKRNCVFFASGKCKDGAECKFNHDFEPKLCNFYVRGHCRRGNKCTFNHDREEQRKFREEKEKEKSTSSGKEEQEGHAEGAANTTKRISTVSESSSHNRKLGDSHERPARPVKRIRCGLHLPEPLSGGSRGSLLRKLLEDEITMEENIVLQCLRYIVQQNFFQPVADTAVAAFAAPFGDSTAAMDSFGAESDSCDSVADSAVAMSLDNQCDSLDVIADSIEEADCESDGTAAGKLDEHCIETQSSIGCVIDVVSVAAIS